MVQLTDSFGRVHDYLRVSLTGSCNLRCVYCNPDGKALLVPGTETLPGFDELRRLIKIFSEGFGFKKIRFTGGEPLARKDFEDFLGSLAELKSKHRLELCLTTNGTLLAGRVAKLKKLGLDRLNISLDSLKRSVFASITGRDKIDCVTGAIDEALVNGFSPLKINCVVIKGVNDKEVPDFIELIRNRDINIRFIEYMPFTANGWDENSFMSLNEMKGVIESSHELIKVNSHGLAEDFGIEGFKGIVSFISPVSNHFCDSCSRLRVTAAGSLRLCLFSEREDELELLGYLKDKNLPDSYIEDIIYKFVQTKSFKHPPAEELARLDHNYMLRAGG